MQIVTTHTNSDFDALASMVAASFLYPGIVRVMPAQVQAPVREYLAVHRDLLQLTPRRSIDLDQVHRLVVTDTAHWDRLDDMSMLADRSDLECIVWDHHMTQGTIHASELHLEEVGATVTLLLERMQARECAFPPMHATLFLLGIYDDTGGMSFPSTTARDAHMVAYLLEHGADLNLVSAYLDTALDEQHIELFNRMLADSQTLSLGSLRLGICLQETGKGLNNLARVVSKFREIKGLDVAIGIFPLTPNKTVVVARGNPRLFDLGTVMRRLGGGGHPGAGSAVVRAPGEDVRDQITRIIGDYEETGLHVRDVMSPLGEVLSPRDSLRDAAARMSRSGRSALLVIDDEGRALGILDEEQLGKQREASAGSHPVTSLMRPCSTWITPEQGLREALQLMSSAGTGFLPVIDQGRVIGEITRTAIILNIYDFDSGSGNSRMV